MIEECGNKEQDDNNVNETVENISNINDNVGTCPDIKSPYMMVECEDIKHNDTIDMETYNCLDTLDK